MELLLGWLCWFWGISFSLIFVYCLVITVFSCKGSGRTVGFIFTGLMFVCANVMYFCSWWLLPIFRAGGC